MINFTYIWVDSVAAGGSEGHDTTVTMIISIFNYFTSQCLHDSLDSKHLPLFFCLARLPSTHTKHSMPSNTIMAVEPRVRNTLEPNCAQE